jgi:trehalose 6-phosphate synthase/phosphatase
MRTWQQAQEATKLNEKVERELVKDFHKKSKRMIFLDYDGTLAKFQKNPADAKPTPELFEILDKLQENPENNLTLITGRDKEIFGKWFGDKPYNLICEHGLWQKTGDEEWRILEQVSNSWFEVIFPIIERFIDRTPGSSLEIKNYSLAWHYRNVDPVLGVNKANELKATIQPLIANHDLEIMDGDKVLEVKVSGVNKGRASTKWLLEHEHDYILAMGDDWTDEFMFKDLPEETVSIKVGNKKTVARYRLKDTKAVYKFLRKLI